jgi:hypothetical protein
MLSQAWFTRDLVVTTELLPDRIAPNRLDMGISGNIRNERIRRN